MAASTITSIENYILVKSSIAEASPRPQTQKKNPLQASDGGSVPRSLNPFRHETDRYQNRIGRFDRMESRMSEQNQVAMTVRAADATMQQIGIRIHHMEDALDKLVKQYPPYPPGSEERIALLRKVNTFRKQIEELTFPPPKDENTTQRSIPDSNAGLKNGAPTMENSGDGGYGYPLHSIAGNFGSPQSAIPQLAEDAPDGEIRASLVRLRHTGSLIHRQRNDLRTEASSFFNAKNALNDNQVAEFKSLFIGKHLSRYPDADITSTPSILKGYLN